MSSRGNEIALRHMNKAQKETFESLLSIMDDLELEAFSDENGAFCFQGNDVDGPRVGYIEPDGRISWLN